MVKMSARVFNPVLMSELRRLRSPVPGVVRRVPPSLAALAKIRKNLFGPVDHEDSRRFVDHELSVQQSQSAERWGFDFIKERPLPGSKRYVWERVSFVGTIPDPYAVRRIPVLHQMTDDTLEQNEPTVENMDTSTSSETSNKNTRREQKETRSDRRQPKITDYLKQRKRLSNSHSHNAKKIDQRPPKRARLSTPSQIASSS